MKLSFCFFISCLALTVPNVASQGLSYQHVLEVVFSPLTGLAKHIANVDLSRPMKNVVRFYCINSNNLNSVEVTMNDADVTKKLNLSLPVNFVIHGWIDSSKHAWMPDLAKEWVKYQESNVCLVDWSRFSFIGYTLAANTNTQIIGHYVADFINFLVTKGVSLEQMSIAGHSLGGQIAGFIGANLDGKLGTIYGLDPAGPLFTIPVLKGIDSRLDPTDAKFVQVIHSSSGMLGVQVNSGHQDFHPNEGVFSQPGCVFPFLGDTLTPEPISCSHFRAIEDFHYSLNPANVFVGLKCNSLKEYRAHKCGEETDILGIHSKRIPGEYYLVTDKKIPFATGRFY